MFRFVCHNETFRRSRTAKDMRMLRSRAKETNKTKNKQQKNKQQNKQNKQNFLAKNKQQKNKKQKTNNKNPAPPPDGHPGWPISLAHISRSLALRYTSPCQAQLFELPTPPTLSAIGRAIKSSASSPRHTGGLTLFSIPQLKRCAKGQLRSYVCHRCIEQRAASRRRVDDRRIHVAGCGRRQLP